MSKHEWNLTPTERRIAEVAFAIRPSGYDPTARAHDAVMAVRSLRADIRGRKVSEVEITKMLEELRREPGATKPATPSSADEQRTIDAGDMADPSDACPFIV